MQTLRAPDGRVPAPPATPVLPDRLVPAMLQYSRWNRDDSSLALVLKGATTRQVAVPGAPDRVRIFGVKLPVYNAQRPSAPILQLVKVTSPSLPAEWQENQPFAVVQVTDLAVLGIITAFLLGLGSYLFSKIQL